MTIKRISAKIPRINIELAKAYIQGAVHSHCNNNANSDLSVRILFGGDNTDWENTPLQIIYDYYLYIKNSNNPAKDAAKDVGWLFKEVLIKDKRHFILVGKNTGKVYRLC